MHPLPRRILRQLLADYGPTLLDDPTRVDALLADLSGLYHKERFLLVHALRERIPSELLAQPQGGAVHGRRLSQRLQKRYGFSVEAAQWAIESWALALGIAPKNINVNHTSKEIYDDSQATLSPIPQRTLNQLLTDWGPDLLNDPGRVDALLADVCGPFPRERFLLFHALQERIPTQLVLAHALREHIPAQMVLVHAPRERALAAHLIHPQWDAICAGWLSQRLQDWYGFSAKAAQWTIESCSCALNIAPPVKYLTPTGKPLTFVNEIMLRILQRDPRSEAWVSAEVLARQKAKEQVDAVTAIHQKAVERDAAEEAVRLKAKEQDDAVAVVRQKAVERDAAEEAVRLKAKEQIEAVAVAGQKAEERGVAEEAVRLKAKEQDEAVAMARQKEEEREAAEEAVRQKAKKREAEKAVSLERANETIAAQETALTKAEEWVATEAADHHKAKEWGAAEEAVLHKAEEWVETKTAEHQKIAGWSTAKAAERQKTKELVAAQASVLRKTEEWVETETRENQKTVEWVGAEAVVLQKMKEWVETKKAARQKTFEWAAAGKAARVKAEEQSFAEKTALTKAEEQSAAEKTALAKAEEQSAAEKTARLIAMEEITLQILKETPMTSREVAAFLDREHEQAISWLRRLQAAGKVEYVWLKRSPHHPCYQSKEQSSSWSLHKGIDLRTEIEAVSERYG